MKSKYFLSALLLATSFLAGGTDIIGYYPIIFGYNGNPEKPIERPTDEMLPFACMHTGTELDFTFTDSMGTVRIAVTNLADGSESTYSVWTPAIHYTIPVQPDTPYQITVTFHSGDTYIGLIQ